MLALVAMALGVFVIANDFTALSVAIPEIEADLEHHAHDRPVGDQRLRPGVRRADRHRRPARRPLRPQAHLHDRRRASSPPSRSAAGLVPNVGAADRVPGLMGIGGALMWPAILGMTYAMLPDEQGGPGRRADPRRRRARQRRRAAARRVPHRRVQLALGVLHQPADHRLRDVGDVAGGPREPTVDDRRAPHRLPRRRDAVDRDRGAPARARRRPRRGLRRARRSSRSSSSARCMLGRVRSSSRRARGERRARARATSCATACSPAPAWRCCSCRRSSSRRSCTCRSS